MEHHVTVLKNEAVGALDIKKDATIVDATFGAGGHSREILSKLKRGGVFMGIDADPGAIERAQSLAYIRTSKANVCLKAGNFRNIDSMLAVCGIQEADGILADLGWRMEQMEGGGKGFSFRANEPLYMTYGDPDSYPFTAADIVNEWTEDEIADVLKGYGEERFAKRIAGKIVDDRAKRPITHSVELAHIVEEAVPPFYRRGKIHPATRTFQALRIAVNDELDALSEFIEKAVRLLSPGGRLAVISFHSLEDRIVKRTFRTLNEQHKGSLLTKKPILPCAEEIEENPRARSAKLRILKKDESM